MEMVGGLRDLPQMEVSPSPSPPRLPVARPLLLWNLERHRRLLEAPTPGRAGCPAAGPRSLRPWPSRAGTRTCWATVAAAPPARLSAPPFAVCLRGDEDGGGDGGARAARHESPVSASRVPSGRGAASASALNRSFLSTQSRPAPQTPWRTRRDGGRSKPAGRR